MAVIPVGAGLIDLEAIRESFTGLDTGEADPGHPILRVGKDDTVPVNGGIFVKCVLDVEGHLLSFLKAENRARQLPIDGHGSAGATGDIHLRLANGQVIRAGIGAGR